MEILPSRSGAHKVTPLLLPLSHEFLNNPIRHDRAIIQAFMLWPDDDEARRRWIDADMVDEATEQIENVPAEIVRRLFVIASKTPTLHSLQENARNQIAHGWIAGMILRQACAYASLGHPVILSEIIGALARGYQRFKTAGHVHETPSVKTVNNSVWPTFRPVAPFWAAWLSFFEVGETDIPCPISDLATFQIAARQYTLVGESIRLKVGTLLRPNETIKFPAPD